MHPPCPLASYNHKSSKHGVCLCSSRAFRPLALGTRLAFHPLIMISSYAKWPRTLQDNRVRYLKHQPTSFILLAPLGERALQTPGPFSVKQLESVSSLYASPLGMTRSLSAAPPRGQRCGGTSTSDHDYELWHRSSPRAALRTSHAVVR